MKTLLWLDDIRNPQEGTWLADFSPLATPFETIWVKSYGEFTQWITENGLPDAICFDHDLGDDFALRENAEFTDWYNLDESREYNGMDCAKWLIDYCIDNDSNLPEYTIQSANPVGKENIDGILISYNKFIGK